MPEKSPESGQAGAQSEEIEITPEMITEGMSVLSDYDPEFDEGGEVVERIYRAMDEALRSRLACGKRPSA